MSSYNLPSCPTLMTESNVVVRMIDAIVSRYANATKGVPESISTYQVCDSAMSLIKVYRHIYQLCYWTASAWDQSVRYDHSIKTLDGYRLASLQMLLDLRHLLHNTNQKTLQYATLYHERTDSYLPFWYIINGPLSDILTHIGQINSWRRVAGHPCDQFSPLFGIVDG